MPRRLIQLIALVVAVGLAAGGGALLRRHLDGPDPVDTVRAATKAYASGDCAGLRAVSDRPASVVCAEVTGVRDAYRSEGLKPAEFTYDVVDRSEDTAAVKISYVRDGRPAEEIVDLVRRDKTWKVLPAPPSFG